MYCTSFTRVVVRVVGSYHQFKHPDKPIKAPESGFVVLVEAWADIIRDEVENNKKDFDYSEMAK
jgi:hypothetical protein